MRSFKVILSNDKVEFFTELMNRLGIKYQDEIQAMKEANKMKGEAERVKSNVGSKGGQKNIPMEDSSIKEVLKKIEQMRGNAKG
nr:hypothetical protein [uncultured Carboxylicivirga sp.]